MDAEEDEDEAMFEIEGAEDVVVQPQITEIEEEMECTDGDIMETQQPLLVPTTQRNCHRSAMDCNFPLGSIYSTVS